MVRCRMLQGTSRPPMFPLLVLLFGGVMGLRLAREGFTTLIHPQAYLILCLLTLIVCWRVRIVDPGFLGNPIVTVRSSSLEELKRSLVSAKKRKHIDFALPLNEQDRLGNKYCGICRTFKNQRVYHCRQVGRCVEQFDHYCFVFGNAIGKNNYKIFLQALFLLDLWVLWTGCILWHSELLLEQIAVYGLLLSGCVSFGMSGFHFYLVCAKQSTIDLVLRNKAI